MLAAPVITVMLMRLQCLVRRIVLCAYVDSQESTVAAVAVATDGKTLKCTACVSGFVRSADVAPVSTAQHCVVRQCNGSGRNCGCGSNEAVIDDGRTLTCSNCATYYGRAADVVPVSTAQNCTVKRCNGKGQHCGCGSNEAVKGHNGTMLSCAVCDPGYERTADTAPVSIAQGCTIQQCDGTNSICGCPANHAVRFLTGYISGLVCKPCSVGYQRSVDTVPITSEQECTVKLCTGTDSSPCGCDVNQALVVENKLLRCLACDPGYFSVADGLP
eukprot:COSAG01_NODE_20357_length_958_cov_1.083818_1_plen_272_part_01